MTFVKEIFGAAGHLENFPSCYSLAFFAPPMGPPDVAKYDNPLTPIWESNKSAIGRPTEGEGLNCTPQIAQKCRYFSLKTDGRTKETKGASEP